MFIHGPWGEIDLRDGIGRFVPRKDALGKEPLELFVTALQEPADALGGVHPPDGQAGDAAQVGAGLHAIAPHPGRPAGAGADRADLPRQAAAVRRGHLPGHRLLPGGLEHRHGTLDFNPRRFERSAREPQGAA